MISQRKPRAPRLRGGRRGSAPAPRAYAAGGGALPLHPAPARRAAGLCPCTPRLRGGRQGSALHPLGLSPQTPEMLTHLFFRLRAGRGLWGSASSSCAVTQPARTAGCVGMGEWMGAHPPTAQTRKKPLAL
ncbi:hypothetical protein D3Z52_12550 [Clostridiaceae bacterium]|nr:hypothetical protein [Clostridiaceae bacterium]